MNSLVYFLRSNLMREELVFITSHFFFEETDPQHMDTGSNPFVPFLDSTVRI